MVNVTAKDFHVTGPDFLLLFPDEGGGGMEEKVLEKENALEQSPFVLSVVLQVC